MRGEHDFHRYKLTSWCFSHEAAHIVSSFFLHVCVWGHISRIHFPLTPPHPAQSCPSWTVAAVWTRLFLWKSGWIQFTLPWEITSSSYSLPLLPVPPPPLTVSYRISLPSFCSYCSYLLTVLLFSCILHPLCVLPFQRSVFVLPSSLLLTQFSDFSLSLCHQLLHFLQLLLRV